MNDDDRRYDRAVLAALPDGRPGPRASIFEVWANAGGSAAQLIDALAHLAREGDVQVGRLDERTMVRRGRRDRQATRPTLPERLARAEAHVEPDTTIRLLLDDAREVVTVDGTPARPRSLDAPARMLQLMGEHALRALDRARLVARVDLPLTVVRFHPSPVPSAPVIRLRARLVRRGAAITASHEADALTVEHVLDRDVDPHESVRLLTVACRTALRAWSAYPDAQDLL